MKTRKVLILVSCLTILGLFLASCTPAASPTATSKPAAAPPKAETPATKPAAAPTSPSPSPKPASGQPKYGGVLTASVYSDMPSLDMHQESVFQTLSLAQPAMNGLVEFDPADPGWKVVPSLGERWDISQDGTKITFYLKKGVSFHDGKPFTSADVKFSLERAGVNPFKGAVLPRGAAFETIAKIETPDDYTVVLTLKYPSGEIMEVLAAGLNLMLPKHIIEPLGSGKIRKAEQIVGTGPFKAKSYDIGVGWELVRSDSYFKKGLPYLDGIRYYIIKDDATRFSAFRTKRILVEAKSPGFTPAQKETIEKSPEMARQVVITTGVALTMWGINMNIRHPGPIGDVRVRKAIHLALDRQRMQKLLAQTQAPGAIASLIHPDSKFALPKEVIQTLPGFRQPKDADIAEARRLLEEAKVPKDFSLTLIAREGAIYRDYATILAEELKNFGIPAAIKIVDTAGIYTVQEKHDFATLAHVYGSWNPSPHYFFGNRFLTTSGQNFEGVSDERIDSLYTKQARSPDVEERKKLFWEMERILREEIIPIVPVFWQTRFTGYWSEVKGYAGYGLGYYEGNRMEDVWLDR